MIHALVFRTLRCTHLCRLANCENQGPEDEDEWPEICEEDDDDDDEDTGADCTLCKVTIT